MNTHDFDRDENRLFSKSIMLSALFHGILGMSLVIKFIFFTDEPIDLSRAVRVDMVALPDQIPAKPEPVGGSPQAPPEQKAEEAIKKPELPVQDKAPEPPADKKVEPKKKDSPKEPTLTTEKKKQKDIVSAKKSQEGALERLKALQALESKTQKERAEKLAHAQEESLKAAQFKGNRLSAGSSLTGVDKLQHESYLEDIDNHVKKFWHLPQWLKSGDYKARIRIKLDKRGLVIEAKLTKPSGNGVFDEKVLETVRNASPFPEPPEKFENILEIDGIELRFPE